MSSKSWSKPSIAAVAAAVVGTVVAFGSGPEREPATSSETSARRARPAARASARPAREVKRDATGRASMVYGAPDDVLHIPASARTPVEASRAYLRAIAPSYDLTEADAAALAYRGTINGHGGSAIVRFTQRAGTTPILGREVAVVMNADRELVAVSGRLTPPTVLASATLAQARARVSAADAVPLAHAAVDTRAVRGAVTRSSTRAVLVEDSGTLVAAHQVRLELAGLPPAQSHFVALVSARDGQVMRTISLAHADEYSYRAFADTTPPYTPWDGPRGTSATPHPTGNVDGYMPPYQPPALVTLQNAPFSRNDAWLPPGATVTAGNNVDAYANLVGGGAYEAGDLRPTVTAPGVFDRTMLFDIQPNANAEQIAASATNAFFITNWLHDVFYDSGFDESAGNAQDDNFGRGGLGGDRLQVRIQDHSVGQRSLAIIPPDGEAPTLSFGIRNRPQPGVNVDVGTDASVVAHEWAHLLANRLVGDALGLANPQGQAIDEGTADFIALYTMIRAEDINVPSNANWSGTYAVGGFAATATNTDAAFFGLRRFTYSVNDTKNNLRYRHVGRGVTLPTTTPFNDLGLDNAEAHAAGEVWASTLLECYVALLRAHPFQEAQDRMRHYLVGGLATMPSSPTFIEARDALFAAAGANDPADRQRFYAAFARRGLGSGALAPDARSSDFVGAVESYQLGPVLRIASVSLVADECDEDDVLDVGERGVLEITVENAGHEDVPGAFTVTAVSASPSSTVSFPEGSTVQLLGIGKGARVTTRLPVHLDSASGANPHAVINFTESMSGQTASLDVLVHTDESVGDTTDRFDTSRSTFSLQRGSVVVPLPASATRGGFAHLDDGPTADQVMLVSPPLRVTSNLSVTYKVRHSLTLGEDVDLDAAPGGAVVEVSTDGIHFGDVTDHGANPAYGGDITSGPLSGRTAMVGMSAGYPAFATRTLAFGDAFDGETVFVRFRLATRGLGRTAAGLDIDDFAVTGVSDAPFATRIEEPGTSCNHSPIADAGSDIVVTERTGDSTSGPATVVTLDALASRDPDGDVLTYSWAEITNSGAVLTTPTMATTTFTVPDVPEDTVLVFRVSVSDGTISTSDTVRVTVRHANARPTAVVTGPTTIAEGGTVVLDCDTSTDSDGDAITCTWSQPSSAITLVENGTEVSFTAPEVSADTWFAITLTVSDGALSSSTTHHVRVTDVPVTPNGRPTAVITGPTTITEGGTVTLGCDTSTDPDSDALTCTWSQPTWSSLSLVEAGTNVSFTAPDVPADTWFTVTLTVSDGELTSAPVSHYVQVTNVPVVIPEDAGVGTEDAGVDAGDMDGGGGGCSAAPSRGTEAPFAAAWMALLTMLVARHSRSRR